MLSKSGGGGGDISGRRGFLFAFVSDVWKKCLVIGMSEVAAGGRAWVKWRADEGSLLLLADDAASDEAIVAASGKGAGGKGGSQPGRALFRAFFSLRAMCLLRVLHVTEKQFPTCVSSNRMNCCL